LYYNYWIVKATEVTALSEYKIKVVFDDGVSGIVDLEELIPKGIFRQLKDKSIFQNIYTDGSAIAWSDELEIDAANIYAEILKTEPAELLHTPSFHAAD